MKYFDIDSLLPDYSPQLAKPKGRKLSPTELRNYERSSWVHTAGYAYNSKKSVGVKPEKILDWRGLERRAYELHLRSTEVGKIFWDALRAAHKEAGLKKGQTLYIFEEEDFLISYNGGGGFSQESSVRIIEDLTKDATARGEFAVMKFNEGGEEIGHLLHRDRRAQRAWLAYERALEKALADRLQRALEGLKKSYSEYGANYYPPQIYLIENEGRVRVAHSCSMGKITLVNGEVLTSK